jgi:hypothetical protein
MAEVRTQSNSMILGVQELYSHRRYINIVARIVWRLYKRGIGLTTGFIGSHTVTHNYSVYILQLTRVHHNTCRVSSLCLHWLPVFQ